MAVAAGLGTTSGAPAAVAPIAIEEVVVTARRREENIQDVPVVISAFSAEALTQKAIFSNQDLIYATPSLVTTNFGGSGLVEAGYIIRGQGPSQGSSNAGGVVAYLSDVPTHLTSMPYYDVSSLQVLNGPQGTLFGRNTTGGAVLIYPNEPKSEFEAYLRLKGGNLNLREIEGALNVPLISDKLMLRVAGNVQQRDGYVTNVLTGQDLNDRDGKFFRVSLRWHPTEWFDNTLIYDDVQIENNGSGFVIAGIRLGSPADLTFGAALAPAFGGQTLRSTFAAQQARGIDEIAINVPTLESRDIWTAINTTRIDLGSTFLGKVAVRNIASFRFNNIQQAREFDNTPLPIVEGRRFDDYSQYWTEEVRLQGSSLEDALNWTLGFYYDEAQEVDARRSSTLQVLFAVPNSPVVPLLILGDSLQKSRAVFGQATYALTDRVNITGGMRYTWDYRWNKAEQYRGPSANICGITPFGSSTPRPLNACFETRSGKWSAPTWTASLDYRLSDNVLGYLAHRRGYKAGTFNSSLDPSSSAFIVAPETVTDYELGIKADWALGAVRGRTNAAIYSSDYEDIQRNVSTVVNNIIGTFTRNAAKARIRGLELTSTVLLTERLQAELMYSYTDAKFLSVDDPILLAQSGGELSGVPEHKGSVTLRHTTSLSGDRGELSFAGTWYRQSKWNWVEVIAVEPLGFSPAVSLVDARVDWKRPLGVKSLELGAFVKNATDERYNVGGTALSSSTGMTSYLYAEPRTWGVDLRYRFD